MNNILKHNWAAITGISFVVIDADSDEAGDWIRAGNYHSDSFDSKNTQRWSEYYFYGLGTNEIKTGAGKPER